MTQCFIGHDRAEIGTADADVDDVADALAGVAQPVTAAHLLGKCRHAVEHRMHFGYDIDAFDEYPCLHRRAQGNVQRRACFRGVDDVAAKHRIDTLTHAALARQGKQQAYRLGIDAVLRVIEVQARSFQRETLAALRIGGEQLAQMCRADACMMCFECTP